MTATFNVPIGRGAIQTTLCYNVPCSAVSERANDNGELILKQGVLNV